MNTQQIIKSIYLHRSEPLYFTTLPPLHHSNHVGVAIYHNDVLTELLCPSQYLTDSNATAILDALQDHPTCQIIDFTHNYLGSYFSYSMAHVLSINSIPSLRELYLDNNPLTIIGMIFLSTGIKTNRTLNTLSMNHCMINGFCNELADILNENESLEYLHLEENLIGSNGANGLALGLLSNHTLKMLNLNRNEIGNEGAYYLSQALFINTTLTELLVQDNFIEEQGAEEFRKAKLVHVPFCIDMTGNELTNDVIDEMNTTIYPYENSCNWFQSIDYACLLPRIIHSIRNGVILDKYMQEMYAHGLSLPMVNLYRKNRDLVWGHLLHDFFPDSILMGIMSYL